MELEAENMLLDAKVTVRQLSDEHIVLSNKIKRLRSNFRKMLEAEIARLDEDEFGVIDDLDRSDISAIDRELGIGFESAPAADAPAAEKSATIVVSDKSDLEAMINADTAEAPASGYGLGRATISDLSEGLKKMAEEPASIGDTIILK